VNRQQTTVASQPPAPRSRKRSGLLGWVYRGMLPTDRWKFWWSLVPALYITALMMTPAAPLLYRPFVPLPTLEQAHHWKGAIKVVPDSSWHWPGTRAAYRYFIQTEQGEFEFHDGYWGRRKKFEFEFNPHEAVNGSFGEIWYHPIYGLLKHELTMTTGKNSGEIEREIYDSIFTYHNKYFPSEKYFWIFISSFFPLIGQIWYIKKWLRIRYIKASSKARRGLK
jgi:hypothetical protein